MKGKRILQNLCAQPEEANLFLVTKETPRCLDSFALKWLKEKQERQGGQTCTHEDIHSWECGGQGAFKGKSSEVAKYTAAEVTECGGPSMAWLEAA